MIGWTLAMAAVIGAADDSSLKVDASRVVNRITPLMYGSCIEDVNHEIYGGLYAQKLFGESFEEPPRRPPATGWTSYGGLFSAADGILSVQADYGAKALRDGLDLADGAVTLSVRLRDAKGENAGLVVRVRDPRVGADAWHGYEVSLSAKHGHLSLGRHRDNFRLLKRVPAKVEAGRWHRLRVELDGPTIRVRLDDAREPAIVFTDTDPAASPGGRVGVRTWGSDADFRDLAVERPGGATVPVPIDTDPSARTSEGLSAAWDPVATGDAVPRFTWDPDRPFNTARSQRIERASGSGSVGIANRGLNRWGIAVRAGHDYAGHLYLRRSNPSASVAVSLQSLDGSRTYARQPIDAIVADWTRHDFRLRPDATDDASRFVIAVDGPGEVWVDQVYLAGTGDEIFHDLPFRGDIARALQDEGLTLLRYGGSMVNTAGYRWKSMIGDRDMRPQYRGTWYPWSTNGFGIVEFVAFCRAAGFEPVVTINIEETPEDAAHLVEYLNAPATTGWGRRRSEDGYPEPFRVKYLEIGNEETVDAHYIERFQLLHAAIRPRDPAVALIIGTWWEPDNPVSRRIVRELNGKAALWDVHVGGDDPRDGAKVDALFTRIERLVREWAPDTKLKACVLEENGGRHDLRRALGHATILNATQRHGDFVLIDCPANCLQALGQNDNGWDQGQLFYTPAKVWGMPPYHAQKMAAAAHQPCRVASEATSPNNDLDLTATRDEAGTAVVLKVVNVGDTPHRASVAIEGFGPVDPRAEVVTLAGALDDRNAPDAPDRVRPARSTFDGASGRFSFDFPARSYTVMKLGRR